MPKVKRKVIEKDGKYYTPRGVELTRCSHTMTEAQFFSFILSALRRATKYWTPKMEKMREGRRAYKGDNKRIKWEYQCEQCLTWVLQKDIEMDHIIPCGGMNGWDKLVPWCQKAFVEKEGYQRLCKNCHLTKTSEERKK
jgi:hypothetical protein